MFENSRLQCSQETCPDMHSPISQLRLNSQNLTETILHHSLLLGTERKNRERATNGWGDGRHTTEGRKKEGRQAMQKRNSVSGRSGRRRRQAKEHTVSRVSKKREAKRFQEAELFGTQTFLNEQSVKGWVILAPPVPRLFFPRRNSGRNVHSTSDIIMFFIRLQ